MSAKLPVISGRKFIKFLENHGYVRDRQRGSHVMMIKSTTGDEITVPLHKELAPGVVLINLKIAKIKRDEFICAMRRH